MQTGDFVKLVVPLQIEKPFIEFSPDWLKWIRELHNTKVELIQENLMAVASGGFVEGWDIEGQHNPPTFDISRWAPTTWLHSLEGSFDGFCQSCNGFRKHRLMCPLS